MNRILKICLILVIVLGSLSGLFYFLNREDVHEAHQNTQEINEIKKRFNDSGMAAAYAYVKENYAGNPTLGHDLAHVIGRMGFISLKDKALAVCDTGFAFGCFHGAITEWLHQDKEAILKANDACTALGFSGRTASCVHGIGHGVMSVSLNVKEAARLCKMVGSGEGYCFDGMYMEYFKNHELSLDSGFSECAVDEKSAVNSCVRNLSMLFFSRNMDVKSVCDKALDFEICVNTYGQFVGMQSFGDIKKSEEMCSRLSHDLIGKCMVVAISEMAFQSGDIKKFKNMCFQIDTAWQEPCLSSIESLENSYKF